MKPGNCACGAELLVDYPETLGYEDRISGIELENPIGTSDVVVPIHWSKNDFPTPFILRAALAEI